MKQHIGDGKWFDVETAEHWQEATWRKGNLSRVPGSQWGHEALYRTARGRWILHTWSNYPKGTPETWGEIGPERAIVWLVDNEKTDAAEQYGTEV